MLSNVDVRGVMPDARNWTHFVTLHPASHDQQFDSNKMITWSNCSNQECDEFFHCLEISNYIENKTEQEDFALHEVNVHSEIEYYTDLDLAPTKQENKLDNIILRGTVRHHDHSLWPLDPSWNQDHLKLSYCEELYPGTTGIELIDALDEEEGLGDLLSQGAVRSFADASTNTEPQIFMDSKLDPLITPCCQDIGGLKSNASPQASGSEQSIQSYMNYAADSGQNTIANHLGGCCADISPTYFEAFGCNSETHNTHLIDIATPVNEAQAGYLAATRSLQSASTMPGVDQLDSTLPLSLGKAGISSVSEVAQAVPLSSPKAVTKRAIIMPKHTSAYVMGEPQSRKRASGTYSCKAAPNPYGYACAACGATSTPVWRAGPHGPKTLCNACGVRYMKVAKKK